MADPGEDVTAEAVARQAVDRYQNDAEFHAKVYRAVEVVDTDLRQSNDGAGLSRFEREVATISAATVLVIDSMDPAVVFGSKDGT